MSSIIFDASRRVLRQSHNLRAILEHARQNPVKRIDVYRLSDDGRRPGAYVCVSYQSGATGETYFVCGSHAEDWARSYSAASPRRSRFAGCEVAAHVVNPGAWSYVALNPIGQWRMEQGAQHATV